MAKGTKGEMSFLEHLEELRWHIIRSVLAILFFAILAYVFSRYIFDYVLIAPQYSDFPTNKFLCYMADVFHSPSLCINTKPMKLVNTLFFGQFSTDMGVSAIAGFILASPFVIWEFWKFIAPALLENERKHARGAVFGISGLFLLGVLFGYFVIVPFTIHFLGTYSISNKVENLISINSYFSTVATSSLASGLIFELPILTYFLSKVGFITPQFMRKYRRHAIIIILIVAAVISSPDVISQIMVAIPLLFLYEISIWVSVGVYKKKEKAV
jgi:Twin arginine targeting (Tat) protein translocase TatC